MQVRQCLAIVLRQVCDADSLAHRRHLWTTIALRRSPISPTFRRAGRIKAYDATIGGAPLYWV
jgi:hypothetical protein